MVATEGVEAFALLVQAWVGCASAKMPKCDGFDSFEPRPKIGFKIAGASFDSPYDHLSS